MANLDPDSAWEFADAIKQLFPQAQTCRRATVQRVDNDGTIWVQLPGASHTTPIQSTGANVQPGDEVLTELRGNSLHITENQTDPAIGATTATRITRAIVQPVNAEAQAAKGIAAEAQAVAQATGQHFFADDNGAHITDVTQDEWAAAVDDNFSDYDPDTKPYHNQLLNSLGILLRTALNNLVSITRSAIVFYDGLGNAASNIVARFGSDGAQVGASDSGHIELTSDELQIVNADGSPMFDVDMDVGTTRAKVWTDSATASKYTTIQASGTQTVAALQHTAAIRGAVQGDALAIPEGTEIASIDLRLLSESATFTESGATASGLRITSGSAVSGGATIFQIRFCTTSDVQWTYGTAATQTLSIAGLRAVGGGYSPILMGVTCQLDYDGGDSFTSTITATETATAASDPPMAYFAGTCRAPRAYYVRTTQGAAFTFGTRSGDIGVFSSTHGEGLICAGKNQAVFGSYNDGGTNDEYALIIGNGTSDSARSNAGALKKDGTAEFAKPLPIVSGGTGAKTAAAARTALGLGDVATKTIVPVENGGTGTSSFRATAIRTGDMTSVADKTWTQIVNMQLLSGTWLVYANVYAAAHSTGYNQFRITTDSSVSSAEMGSSITMPSSVAALYAPLPITVVTASSSANTLRIFAWQNSGGALNMRGSIRIMRIG